MVKFYWQKFYEQILETADLADKFCQLNALEEVIQSVNEGPISFAGKFCQ